MITGCDPRSPADAQSACGQKHLQTGFRTFTASECFRRLFDNNWASLPGWGPAHSRKVLTQIMRCCGLTEPSCIPILGHHASCLNPTSSRRDEAFERLCVHTARKPLLAEANTRDFEEEHYCPFHVPCSFPLYVPLFAISALHIPRLCNHDDCNSSEDFTPLMTGSANKSVYLIARKRIHASPCLIQCRSWGTLGHTAPALF